MERGSSTEPMGLRGRLVVAAVGLLLVFLSWGLAGLLFPLADPRAHDRWWRVSATLAALPLAVGMVVLGPLGILAPEWVADPDGASKWPRTPDRAVATGWLFLVGEVLLAVVLLRDRRNRRQVDRARRR